MSWGPARPYPRAIMHIDGDSFFASCEVAKDPRLRGKPVITGKERGIVSACTYEAKRAGVKRGMTLRDVRAVCPDAVILPSDYETYSIVSARMYSIVRRYTPALEEYSIDECFADLTGMRRALKMSYESIAATIKRDLETELGMTFSVGLSATKVLAKIGSKWKKPDGLTAIPLSDRARFLTATPVGGVWGIGPNTAAYLAKYGVTSAHDFAERSEAWVMDHVSKPFQEIWHELRGESVYELDTTGRSTYQSIQKTKTFTPPSSDPRFIAAQLSKNIENACIKARRWGLVTLEISFFLKTQEFRFHAADVGLTRATDMPEEILGAARAYFARVYRPGTLYRATGVTLLKLREGGGEQLDLFGQTERSMSLRSVYEQVDEIDRRFGKHTIFLASSSVAMDRALHAGDRGDAPERPGGLFRGETTRKRLGITHLGEV